MSLKSAPVPGPTRHAYPLASLSICLLLQPAAHAQYLVQKQQLSGATGSTRVFQGTRVALSDDGNTVIEGGYYESNEAGAAWIFARSNGAWLGGAKLLGSPGSRFGQDVAISADGNTAA